MKIAVVGCGIGGLTVASFLSDAAYEVVVFDQFTKPADSGAKSWRLVSAPRTISAS